MSFGIRLIAVLALSTAIATSAAARSTNQPFTVSSSLNGKAVLPHRIHWLAVPQLPRAQLAEVDFLIDGKVRWVEHNPPYAYGDDGNWLVTSWLTPGPHRFTTRARSTNGKTAVRTTIARVLPAPPPPAELAGSWSRAVPPGQTGGAPAGTWVLSIDEKGWKIRDPEGTGGLIDVAALAGGRIEARGGIWTMPHNPYEGNAWCEDTNTPVDYRWTVSANTLTLTLDGPDRCGGQHFIWAGTWTRKR